MQRLLWRLGVVFLASIFVTISEFQLRSIMDTSSYTHSLDFLN